MIKIIKRQTEVSDGAEAEGAAKSPAVETEDGNMLDADTIVWQCFTK